MQNQQIPKQTAKATMEGTVKRRRLCKRRKDEGDEDLNIMGTKAGRQWSQTVRNGRRLYWMPRPTMDCSA